MMGNSTSTPLTTSNLANLNGEGASQNNKADDLVSISTLSSLSDSDLSELESDDEEEEEEVPVKKKPRVSAVRTKTKGGKANGKGKALKLVGGLPTPSPTSVGSSEKKGSKELKEGTKRTRDQKERDEKEYMKSGFYWSTNASSGLALFNATKGKGKGKKVDDHQWTEKEDSLIMPLPVHYGDTLIEDERDFRLPFDIMRDFAWDREDAPAAIKNMVVDEEEQERRETTRKPEKYSKIARNIYVERKPEKSDMPAICQCKKPSGDELGCGEDCYNRMMQYSCDAKTCPCGDKCSNLPLGMQKGIPEGKDGLRVVWTGNRGFGLKTNVDIKKGDFVIEYRGEIISRNESYRRVLTTYKDAKSYYFLDYDGWECLDAGQRGNASRFINHSCGPNLMVVRWKLNGLEEYQMGIFAKHDIPAGTELTYDYGWQDFSAMAPGADSSTAMYAEDPSRQKCYCGADVCSGYLGGKKKEKEVEKSSKLNKKKSIKRKSIAKIDTKVKVQVEKADSMGDGLDTKVVKIVAQKVGVKATSPKKA